MTRVLLLTNDFPPRRGGIQSYLEAFVGELLHAGTHDLTVYAPTWKDCADYDRRAADAGYRIVRHPTTLMLPEPTVAGRMRDLIDEHGIDTVWFGAAAPLALLGPLARRAGAGRIVASTHGHEVGWSMLPVARSALRRIGEDADVITYVSDYTRGRFAAAFGRRACLERLSPGVDIERFAPDSVARAELRVRYGLGDRPVVLCLSRLVPRKGQDMLIRAFDQIRRRVPGAALVIVGGGPYRADLEKLARRAGVTEDVVFTGGVPVVAGRSGGAPETVRDGETGWVVDGTDVDAIATAVGDLLADPRTAARMGAAGREWVVANWQWHTQGARLTRFLG